LVQPQVRYISLAADYLVLFLLAGLVFTGVWMRYFAGADLLKVKEFALGFVALAPQVPEDAGLLFYVHLLLACGLAAWFPFSKLMHMGGAFLSPTRNLANNNRRIRHVNPWDHPVKVHTYAEWESEFRDKIKAAGLPLEER
jgi:nitrate reductase gamma subunit